MRKGIVVGLVVMLLGLLLIVAVGVLFVPHTETVYVATTDIAAGEKITPEKVRRVQVSIRNADAYLNPNNVARYAYGILTQSVAKGEFIPVSAIISASNPKAKDYRVALGLDKPDLVAFTIALTPDNAPNAVKPGDLVDISIAIGSASFLTGKLENQPTPVAFNPYRSSVSISEVPGLGGTPTPTPLPTATPTPTPQNFTMPVAKLVVYNLRVLAVNYEEKPNPAYSTSTEGSIVSPFIRGDIRSITVAIPRDQVEALTFALSSASQFHVLVHSPLYTPQPKDPVMAGVAWDDFVAYFKWMREAWAAGLTDSYPIAGMAERLPTLEATLHPPTATPTPLPATAIPTPTPTPTPTP